ADTNGASSPANIVTTPRVEQCASLPEFDPSGKAFSRPSGGGSRPTLRSCRSYWAGRGVRMLQVDRAEFANPISASINAESVHQRLELAQILQAFQADDEGSIPFTRSNLKIAKRNGHRSRRHQLSVWARRLVSPGWRLKRSVCPTPAWRFLILQRTAAASC